jgi:hypothetical protein
VATEAELQYLVRVNDRDLKELTGRVKEMNRAVGTDTPAAAAKAGDGHAKAWGVAKKAALLGGAAILLGAKSAIDAASNLNEQISKTGVVFGAAGADVIKFSKTTATGIGISQRAALEAAGTFGNMLVPMGIAPGAAAKLSTSMVQLAGDMASFNNANPEEVMDALRSGLSGETEPLRRFGVFLNADRVAAEAFALGLAKPVKNAGAISAAHTRVALATSTLNKAIKEHGANSDEAKRAQLGLQTAENGLSKALDGQTPKLTAAQKAQATYSLIMKDTTAAQGDYARTSSGAANSQRTLAAQTEDLRAKLGAGLLPAYAALLGVMQTALVFFSNHTTTVKVLVGVLAGMVALVYGVAAAQAVAGAATAAWTALQWAGNAAMTAGRVIWASGALILYGLTGAQWALNAAMAANPFVLVALLLAALVAGLVIAYQRSTTFRNIVNAAFNAVRSVVSSVIGWITSNVPAAFASVLNWVKAHWRTITVLVSGPFAPIVALFLVAAGHLDDLRSGFSWIRDQAGSIFSGLKSKAQGPLGTIASLLGTAASAGERLASAFRSAASWASSLWSKLASLASKISSLPSPPGWLTSHFATGGFVTGKYTGQDTIQAMIGRGEAILNEQQINALGRDRVMAVLAATGGRTETGALLSSLNPASLMGLGGAGGPGGAPLGPITINIYDARDSTAVAQAVRTELVRVARRNGTALGGYA